jgi:hypothetical protein
MTITHEKYLECLNKDRSSDPVYHFTHAMLKAAEVPHQPGRTDLRKAKAYITLYDIVQKQTPEGAREDFREETQRLWDALSAQERVRLKSKPASLMRKVADMIKA